MYFYSVVTGRHCRGSWPSVRSPTSPWLQHQRFLDKKKITAVAAKPPSYTLANCFKATVSGTDPRSMEL